MAEKLAAKNPDAVLDLRTCINDLITDGHLSQDDANLITSRSRSREEAAMHPLNYIASLKLHDQLNTGGLLDDNALCHWLSERARVPLFNIDPLKINVSKVTEVMSFDFAQRHHILCVDVNSQDIVVASAQPNATGWEEQLYHIVQNLLCAYLLTRQILPAIP